MNLKKPFWFLSVDLSPTTLLNTLTLEVLFDDLRFSSQTTLVYANEARIPVPILSNVAFIPHSCLVALARTSNAEQKRSKDSDPPPPHIIPDPREVIPCFLSLRPVISIFPML